MAHRFAAQLHHHLRCHHPLSSLSLFPPCCCSCRHLSTTKLPSSPDENESESTSLKRSNRAQEYESRHSTGLFGFNTHDGPVPTRRRRRTAAAANLKQQRGSQEDESDSLINPFHSTLHPDQTHLIQGGTPYDQNVGPAYQLADYGESSVFTLILLRHGESEWNQQNRYTGWVDVNLTKRGEDEARSAGRLLAENGIQIDHAFTSVLKRASYTLDMCLAVAGQQ